MIVFLCHAFADKAIWGIEKAGEKTADDAADRPCKSAFFKYTTDQDAAGERQNDAAGFASCDFFMEKYCRQKQYKTGHMARRTAASARELLETEIL